jgi:filamentous hemagglutinin
VEETGHQHLLDIAGGPVDPKTLSGANRGIFTTTEKPAMSQAALDYQSSLPGAVTDMTTRKPIVPGIRYDNPNIKGKNYILFDGLDPYDSTTLVDRKLGIARSKKQEDAFRRWAEALEQNPGIKIRIEVPSRKVWREVEKFINNIGTDPSSPLIYPDTFRRL